MLSAIRGPAPTAQLGVLHSFARINLPFDFIKVGRDATRSLDHHEAQRRGDHALRPAVEQFHSIPPLQPLNAFGQGRLTHMGCLGRLTEASLICQSDQMPQVMDVVHDNFRLSAP